LFSNPAGDFGSLVNDQVVDGNWESGDELGNSWASRNAFSYGRQDKGQARPEILTQLLKTTSRVVQEIDSVEYGLTDIQEYYANTGGLKRAAEKQRGKTVTASFVESFSKDTTPRKLEDLLRLEYRTKLLNPKWADAMANQGSGGAYEISQRMTALIGWGGTVDFTDSWVYDQAADTYALDAEMAKKLREANPEAFRNVVGRMLEAHGRGFWQPSEEKLQKLRELYELTDEELEGVTV
jgi:magnesium chelatase subunit H